MVSDSDRLDQRDIDVLLECLDHPVPAVQVEDVVSRARVEPPRTRWRLAAAILLTLAVAGGAYAFPGSPLRRWAESLGSSGRNRNLSPEPAPPPTPDAQVGAGIAVDPGQNLVIRFTSAEPRGEVRVTLVDGAQVVVQSSSSGVTFTSELDRLLIENTGSPASFDIHVPRLASRIEIRIAEGRVFLKEGSRVDARGSRQSDGSWLIPLRGNPSF